MTAVLYYRRLAAGLHEKNNITGGRGSQSLRGNSSPLEDEGDEGCKYPRPPCTLAKILPETTMRAWFRQIENASPLQTHFLLFEQIFFVLVRIHPGTPRVPPRVLPLGQNPAGTIREANL